MSTAQHSDSDMRDAAQHPGRRGPPLFRVDSDVRDSDVRDSDVRDSDMRDSDDKDVRDSEGHLMSCIMRTAQHPDSDMRGTQRNILTRI